MSMLITAVPTCVFFCSTAVFHCLAFLSFCNGRSCFVCLLASLLRFPSLSSSPFFCSFPILVSVSGSVTVRLALLDFIQCQLAAYINTGPVDQELTQLLL